MHAAVLPPLDDRADARTDDRASREPQRRCIASGQVRPKDELLRFAVDPAGMVVPDPAGRLPGRGLWLSPRRDMLEKACARNLFAKAAKAPVRVPEDLPGRTEGALRRRFLELLGLANRAGQTVAGFQQVRAYLGGGTAALLVQAADGAADGRQKIAALAMARQPELPRLSLFTAAELGPAIGREQVVHLLVLSGGLAERLEADGRRLAGLLGDSGMGS
jgi:predicted RNA-binding protein YlxR (DUF448 family)/ribosomal protein L30E